MGRSIWRRTLQGIKRVCLLAQAGGQHQRDASGQGSQSLFGKLLRQGNLRLGQNSLRINQAVDRASFWYRRCRDVPDHNTLHSLMSKRHLDQVPRFYEAFQLRGQVVIVKIADLRNIDGDFYESRHGLGFASLGGWQRRQEGNTGNTQPIHRLNPQAHPISFNQVASLRECAPAHLA